jgi:GH15 family glucan-1,4-alpha-glucosidase
MAQEVDLTEGRWTRLQPETCARLGNNGSIDWLCFPCFDYAAYFTALLGDENNGRWQIAAAVATTSVERRYRPGTLVFETDFETSEDAALIVDFIPPRDGCPDVIRFVEGLGGNYPQAFSQIGLLSSISALNEGQ